MPPDEQANLADAEAKASISCKREAWTGNGALKRIGCPNRLQHLRIRFLAELESLGTVRTGCKMASRAVFMDQERPRLCRSTAPRRAFASHSRDFTAWLGQSWKPRASPRSSTGLRATQLDDLDGVVLVPMADDDVSIDDMKPPPLPDLQVEERNDGPKKFPALDGMGSSSPRIAKLPDVEGLEDGKRSLTGEVIATGMELSLPKTKGKAGKNKRWLKGRGAAKRRKLEENSRLEKWLETNGVWVSETAAWGQPAAGVSMAVETREQTENEVSGRGLVARRDIEQYEDLARVPKPLLLTKESSCEVFGEECIPSDMSEYPAIALHLIYEKFVKKEESFWAPYIAVLPSTEEVGASFSWEDEELNTLLNGSICRNMSLYLKEQVRDELERHQATIFKQFPEKFPADAFTYDNYVWAYAILFSRAVRLDFPDGQDEEDTVALVPYIDLINHNPNSESRIRGVSEGANVPGITSTERYVVVRSDRYYNKYEQIYITYGRKSNAQLLMLYGFSMERNTQDSVTIAAGQLMETSPFADVKKRVLDEMEVPPEGVFPLYRDRFTNEMMMYLRMAIIQPEDLDLDDDADPKQVYRALKQLDIKQATGE
eukprot:s4326_g6.t2